LCVLTVAPKVTLRGAPIGDVRKFCKSKKKRTPKSCESQPWGPGGAAGVFVLGYLKGPGKKTPGVPLPRKFHGIPSQEFEKSGDESLFEGKPTQTLNNWKTPVCRVELPKKR